MLQTNSVAAKLRTLPPAAIAAIATLCAAAGVLTVYRTAATLIDIWTTDDLKSMGLVVPFVCWLLILRAWRTLGWETQGSWWGLVVLAASAGLMFLRDEMLLIVTVNKDWLLQLPPLPLEAVIYATGLVLLFGGPRLLRAAWFPVLFMWAVIPVPQTFSRRVDLPLQHASASVARAWAHALGQPLTQDKLRLMFTPDFGMFIAPGCNGIRGAITLGMAAIVVGYLYRFRWFVYAPVVAGAVMLGYLFNFLRLCLLVVYYKLALPYPWFQHHAKNADYLIGGCLFLGALAIFFTVADKLRQHPEDVLPEQPAPATPREPPIDSALKGTGFSPYIENQMESRALAPEGTDASVGAELNRRHPGHASRTFLLRCAALLLLSAVFGLDVLHERAQTPVVAQTLPPLPATIGSFHLVRTWTDTLLDGIVVYTWGEYAAPDLAPDTPGPHVSFGISPQMGVHDAEVCHIARGEDPLWHGQIEAVSASGTVDLTAAAYNDGITQRLEASTVCDNGACRQFSQTGQHVTIVYARPHRGVPLQADTTRPVPVLLKVETTDVLISSQDAERQMQSTLTAFLKDADLIRLTAPFSHR